MPLDDVYHLRQELEEGIRKTFEGVDIAAITRANAPKQFQQATPRVEIKCSIGAANGHRFPCPDGFARFDRWRCRIGIQCITRPSNDGKSELHEDFIARVRALSSVLAQVTWTDTGNFPNTRLAEPLRDSGDDNILKTNEGVEYSTIGFAGTICIRESAWNVVAPPPPVQTGELVTPQSDHIVTVGGDRIVIF